jgi:DNA-binding beta-propeller fold protein YncE
MGGWPRLSPQFVPPAHRAQVSTAIVIGPDGVLYVSNHGTNRVIDLDGATNRPLGEVLRIDEGDHGGNHNEAG